MPRFRARGREIALAALVLGTALILAAGYLVLLADSDDASTNSMPSISPPTPQSTQAERVDPSKNPFDPENKDQPGLGTNGVDPLANAAGDTRLHDVTVTLRSDGPIRWLFRTRSGDSAPQDANRSVSFTRRIRGPLPAAQIFVQVIPRSSYATCTISIDGVVVESVTAKKAYQAVACTG